MDYTSYSDSQICDEISTLRSQLEQIRVRLESGDGDVEYNDARTKMSRLNLLKLEATRRGLRIEE